MKIVVTFKKASKNLLGPTLFIILCLFMTSHATAQSYTTVEGDSIYPRFYAETGFYFPNITTRLRVDGDRLGTEINLEDDFNFEEDMSVFRLGGYIRISPKSQIAVSYTRMNRNRQRMIDRDIEWNDTVFQANSDIRLKFNVNYFAATYRYSFFNEKNWNAGLSVGLRGVDINTSINAVFNAREFGREASVLAPAILFGVHGSAYLTPKLLARYSLEYFYLSVNGIDVTVVESNASAQYFIFKNVGLGLAFATNNYRLRDIPLTNDFDGKVEFGFGGFNLFVSARF